MWYKNYFLFSEQREEPTGALPLSGYRVSLPDVVNQNVFFCNVCLHCGFQADGVSRSLVFKLTHPTKRPYYFQLLSEYEFNK